MTLRTRHGPHDGHVNSDAAAQESSRPQPTVSRRWSAAGALLALVGALVVVAVGLVGDLIWLPVAILAVFVAVLAGWAALVNTGVRRIVASLVAIAALAGLVVALLNITPLLQIALVVVLVLVSAAAGRYALGHDLVRSSGSKTTVAPARRGVLLLNPKSGGGKVERFDLVAAARRHGVRPIVLRQDDDLVALAEQAIRDGADVIGMAGGDGSQALVADVARRRDVGFVCVPAGTRNHFALDLGLDRDDVPAAIEAFGEAIEQRVDLALIGDRIFVNNASLGVYAAIVQSEAYRDAKLATAAQLLPDLLGPGKPGFDLRFRGPDGTEQTTADLVLVSNDVYRRSSLGGFGTRENITDGVLGVVALTIDRGTDLASLMAAEARRIDRFSGYRAWTTREFRIDSAEPLLDVGVDGEALRLAPPLVFRSLPGALRVRTPVDAPGASPAAVRPAGIGLGSVALLRVLAGRPAA